MTTPSPTLAWRVPTPAPRISRGLLARTLVHAMVAGMPIRLRYPDDTVVGGGDDRSPTLDVRRAGALFRRLESHPKIGLGEGYMAGDWTAAPGTDLAEALMPFAQRMGSLLPRPVLALRALVDKAIPAAHRNSPEGARANIAAHYDLSNDLFAAFLDPTMTYSSALFAADRPWAEQSLAEAQERKIDAVLDAAGVTAGSRVLEIGTGWGELALRAGRRGADVTSITLSEEQRELATAKITRAGLADRVTVRLQDYREVEGRFDAVISVEMIEAVGEEYWPTYFAALDRVLDDGGTVVLQSILMDHHRLVATRHSFGWIQKYIFPGGLIPSLTAIEDVTRRHTSLQVTAVAPFGRHYAETLRRWRATFIQRWPEISGHGFTEEFRRMWEFYLAYCEAGFATGYLDVAHLTLRRAR